MDGPLIQLRGVSVRFGRQQVLRNLQLAIEPHQTVCVIGESGCGKTVTLKLVVGLLTPTTGEVLFEGKRVSELPESELTALRLRMGFLFQQAALFDVLDRALDALTATREREGAKLGEILRDKLDAIERVVADVRGWMPEIRAALRTRLETRLADLKQPVEPGRLEQELVLQITRTDVDEELDRLATHVGETRRVLGLKEPVGRRLDFLMQEFNREANTLGSKSVDARSTNAAVELKVLIEQMREQVQNIE